MTAQILDGPVSSVTFCWRIERRDGAGLALTSHDRMIAREGESFASDPGVVPAAITRGLGTDPAAGEVSGALSSDAISEVDLGLGRWDGARVTLLALDWQASAIEPLQLLVGEIGEVSVSGSAFSAELRGAASQLSEPACPTTSPECRAQLGDKQCRVDLAGRTMRATIMASSGAELQLDRGVSGQHLFGRIVYLSGPNCGDRSVVLAIHGDRIRVRDLPRSDVDPGTQVELRHGCDRTFDTCVTRFGNAANFRGEPHLPGNDLLTRYPGA